MTNINSTNTNVNNLSKPKVKKPNIFVKCWSGFKEIIPYIKLQTKLAFAPTKQQTKTKKIVSWLIKAIVYALILLVAFVFIKNLTKQTDYIRGNNFLILFVTLSQFILLIYSVSIQVRRLYKPSDPKQTC